MRKALRVLVLAAASVALLAGCRSAPVRDVINEPVVVTGQRQATMEDVEKAIVRAGSALGWRMRPVAPGLMEGTLNLRSHTAIVDITYDTRTYSIKYKDSTNLGYDGKNIHSNYNGWIENLDKGIQTQLVNL
jgi:type IV pilus biogenesis protein CpaD/CtpE